MNAVYCVGWAYLAGTIDSHYKSFCDYETAIRMKLFDYYIKLEWISDEMKTQTKSDEINCKLVGKQWHLLKCEFSIECKRCTCAIHQFTSIPFQGNAVGTTMASKFYLPGKQPTSLACSSQYIIIGEWSVRTNTGVFVLKFRQLFF